LNKDSKGALVELSRPAVLIAHLDSGLQNRLAELFADVPAAVESLGYGTDRDPQPVCDVFDCRSQNKEPPNEKFTMIIESRNLKINDSETMRKSKREITQKPSDIIGRFHDFPVLWTHVVDKLSCAT
jgi:hypothetical protein